MTSFSAKQIMFLSALFVFALAVGARAQDISNTTVQHGPSEYDTSVRNAEVVYVSGNDLVLKLEDGRVEHIVVPDSDKFHVDGRELSVHELTPGTKLTETITTTTIPRMVTTVRTIDGKVWHVNRPNSVVLTLPDGTNKQYKIPKDQKFMIDGQEKTAFDLKKGMKISATVVTDSPETAMSQSKTVTGQAPKPATPSMVGALLFLTPRAAGEPVTTASAEPAPEKLPKTGSILPLVAVLGMLSLSSSLAMKYLRQS
jgi:hypothetical protein